MRPLLIRPLRMKPLRMKPLLMRPLPLQVKIALLSLVIAGVLVAGFGAFFLRVIHQVGRDRVDREIKALAEGQLHGRHPLNHWQDFGQSLRFVYGDDAATRPAVQVRDTAGNLLYSSPEIPQAIAGMTPPALRWLEPAAAAERPPPALPGGERRDGGGFVARLDRDGDGAVSRQEFDGPGDQFPSFDLDGDGFVREAEARLANPLAQRPPAGGRGPAFPRGSEPRGSEPPPTAAGRYLPPRQKVPQFHSVETPAGSWRVGFVGNDLVTLTVGLSLADLARDAGRFRRAFLLLSPLALCALAAGGWWLARRALRPVALITRTAESLGADRLDRRVPVVEADPEIQRLADVINGMLERLERSFLQAARFSSDAAHAPQTPLTVLQGEPDNAIQAAPAGSDEQRLFTGLLEEVRKLKAIVHKLLILARADAGRLSLNLAEIDLGALAEAAAEDLEALAPDRHVELAAAPRVRVRGDSDLVGQAVSNLTSNALKYSPAGSLIRLEVKAAGEVASLRLTNTAAPIPAAARERIFDRFYRLDASRSGSVGSSGLGLSLAREIARAHGGDLILDPQPEDSAGGAVAGSAVAGSAVAGNVVAFTLTLPLT